MFNVSIEALRSEDLPQSGAAAARPGPGNAQPGPRRAGEPSLRPAKHPLLVRVELAGTPARLRRAVARPVAINEVVTETD